MCKKLIYLIPFILALIAASNVQAEPFSLGATDDAHIGKDADLGLTGNANLPELQIHNVEGSRRVTLISYNISELKGGRKFIANASFSNYGQNAGLVNVYGIIEGLDDNIDETTITWNTAPGVFKSSRNPAIGAPVALVMTDLTGPLLTFTAPEPGVRASTGTSQALDDFLNSDTDGIVAFLFAPAEEGTQATIQSKEHESGGTLLEGQVITPKGFNIIWVSYHGADDAPSSAAAAAGFTEAPDKGYTDLLKFNGYNVMRYITTGTPDVSVLNAADLVIIGRSAASSHYQNDAATTWNATVTAPMIITCGYKLRSSRLGFTTGTNMPDTTGDITLTVSDPTHPIFAGIPLTNGTMDNPYAGVVIYPTDGTTVARGISINTDPVNAEGTVLATISEAGNGPVGGMVIAEWQAGATLTHAGGAGTDTLAGHRLVFLTGSRETDGISSETAGIYDLYADGAQMFLNAVAYMLGISELEPVNPGTNGLVAHYAFENDANDSSGNNFHGTVVGDPVFVEGPAGYGMALDFDGDGDYVDCGNNAAFSVTDAITISVWINMRAIAGDWRAIIAKGDSAWRISTNASTQGMHFGFTGSSRNYQRVDSATQVPFNEWHHICATYDITVGGHIYIDGIEDGENPETLGITTNNSNLYIGNNSDNPDRFWDGLIDEVAIYNRAVSEAEVLYLAGKRTTPVDPGSAGLLAWWPCDEGEGTVVGDASGNGHDGVFVNGDPAWVEGIHGSAVELVGPTLIEVPPLNVELTEATMAGWIKPYGPQPDWSSFIMTRTPGLATGFNVLGYQLAYHWNDTSDSWSFRGGDMIAEDDWTFAAVTIEPDKATFYVNGEAGSVNEITHGPCLWNSNVYLGGDGNANWIARRMNGALDDVLIYDRALSAGEIRYLAGFRPMVDPGTDALVAYYPLDNDVLDGSGNGNDGTIFGNPTFVEGVDGMALKFDGAGDYVDCGSNPILAITDAVSISAWIKVAAQGLDHKIGGNQDGTNGGYKMTVFNNNRVEFEIRTATNSAVLNRNVAGGTEIEVDVWYHVAGVYSLEDGYIRTYVNGELDRELLTTQALGASPGTFKIGCEPFSTGQYNFNGVMDDIRVYNKALSEAEVRYLANK